MSIVIKLLKNNEEAIPALAKIWYEVLGKPWIPGASIPKTEAEYQDHINADSFPLTLTAYDGELPVGMCSLRENDGIREDLSPWLGSLVIDKAYQGRGIGKMLIKAAVDKARAMGVEKLYLFVLDHSLVDYYGGFGWKVSGLEDFRGQAVVMMERVL